MNHPDGLLGGNHFVPAGDTFDPEFERAYCLLRAKEERMYTDQELLRLPNIDRHHPHSAEWRIRRKSAGHLIHYLESKGQKLQILEVGCGNGWLSHLMSRIPGSKVLGLDINMTELNQAARVFGESSKLKFIFGDIRQSVLNDKKFDVVIFASSIQYFPVCAEVIQICLRHLFAGGEIHMLDSLFYEPLQLEAARKRSTAYFSSMGFPEMSAYYHHHTLGELDPFACQILRDPRSIRNRVFSKSPFFWICIKNEISC